MVCTYRTSQRLPVDTLVGDIQSSLGGRQLGSSTPVWIQAWGGEGGHGGSGSTGAPGRAGYAMTVSSVGTLTAKTLYLYVANGGTHHRGSAGQGGASTIVSTQMLSQTDVGRAGRWSWPAAPAEEAMIAAAASSEVAAATAASPSPAGPTPAARTEWGIPTPRAKTVATAATWGTLPARAARPAGGGCRRQVGARRARRRLEDRRPDRRLEQRRRVDPDAADWTGGAGGHGKGGGGGGYGGGGGGKGCDNQGSGGGGGGGSWKQVAALTDPDAPTDSKQSPNTSQQVVLTFNL
jgi:hypothetical protein